MRLSALAVLSMSTLLAAPVWAQGDEEEPIQQKAPQPPPPAPPPPPAVQQKRPAPVDTSDTGVEPPKPEDEAATEEKPEPTATAADNAAPGDEGGATEASVGGEEQGQLAAGGDAAAGGTKAGEASDDGKKTLEDFNIRDATTLNVGGFRLAPIMLIQAYGTPYVGEQALFQSGDIAERGGFRLRRARLGFDANYRGMAELRVSSELNSQDDGQIRVHSAYVGFTPLSYVNVHAGAMRMPISRFSIVPSARSALIDRPLATRAMAPGQQIGVLLSGELFRTALGYQLGLYNGLQRSNFFYQGYAQNFAPFGNRFDGLAYAVRLTTDPLGRTSSSIADEEKVSSPRVGAGANYLFSDGGSRDVHTAGGDLHFKYLGIHLIAEGLYSRVEPEEQPTVTGALPFDVTSYSIVGEAGYMFIKQMLGTSIRFEWIDPDTSVDDESDNWLITGGAQVQLVDSVLKGQLEYTHREERHGQSLDNDSFTIALQGYLDPVRDKTGTRR